MNGNDAYNVNFSSHCGFRLTLTVFVFCLVFPSGSGWSLSFTYGSEAVNKWSLSARSFGNYSTRWLNHSSPISDHKIRQTKPLHALTTLDPFSVFFGRYARKIRDRAAWNKSQSTPWHAIFSELSWPTLMLMEKSPETTFPVHGQMSTVSSYKIENSVVVLSQTNLLAGSGKMGTSYRTLQHREFSRSISLL